MHESDYDKAVNMPGFWLITGFWICLWYDYTRVLNIYLEFWLCHGSEYARVTTQGSDYAWIISECAWICVNMPRSAWMAFALHFPFVIPCLNEHVVTYFNVYINLEVIIWRSFKFGVTFRGSDGGGGARARGREYWYTFINIYTFDSDNSFCFFEHANELIHLIT